MVKVNVVDPKGRIHTIEANEGEPLMHSIRDAGLPMLASCGGNCACATCHVLVPAEIANVFTDRSEAEIELLQDSDYFQEPLSRLACQMIVVEAIDGITIEIPPSY
ncbi:2Fe-2S iron-sulfur cluster-binding protein [Chelatococcus asaccharovorans]|uniref:2Fe-2S ferredoxin n=1 Tax=Chelatococcus asaccharovorans TaxID=28210 RepID=A0A2V3TRJ7_9HYPH|nr:2Fe-2S iron-sulfur cluster-binding protein [Chelatococcus asaccharovorans]MBS7708130.1 (2Fe-2S)-binding protein [Chelatococcus asaccharovorans]PXW50700.1 2Fe-2S ferredoxin [Chelatococcus asaccharovorans]